MRWPVATREKERERRGEREREREGERGTMYKKDPSRNARKNNFWPLSAPRPESPRLAN